MTRMRTAWLLSAMLVFVLLAANCVAPATPATTAQQPAATATTAAAAQASAPW